MSIKCGFVSTFFLICAACSGSKDAGSSTANDATAVEGSADCSTDSRVSPYKTNMQSEGSVGKLTFTLVEANPHPPAQGMNAWSMQVAPKGGAPSTQYKLSVAPYMPDHGHGPSTNPNVTVRGDNTYQVDQIDFFMGGVWRVTATASDSNNTQIDSANFFFCVPG